MESRDLQSGHGFRACSFENKRKKLIFHEIMKVTTCFFTKSVKFGFGELSICWICAESRDLQSGHGFRACSFKNKRKKLDFHTFWDETADKKRKRRTKSVEFWSPEL